MNRKNLTAAVLAGLAGVAGIVGSAQAVNINPDGLGQVLIYPYYTVNAENSTLLSVVNTTDQAKAVKVRFLEGKNSREVLDFNLYMSAYDVWTAAVYNDDGLATLATADNTCTVPYIYGRDNRGGDLEGGKVGFLPYALIDEVGYDPTDLTTLGDISRATEGHFEVIEMGVLTNESQGSAIAITHVAGELPAYVPGAVGVWGTGGCQQLVNAWTDPDDLPTATDDEGYWLADHDDFGPDVDMDDPSGGLFGGAGIVNVGVGTLFTYDAKAIDGFSSSQMHNVPGNTSPNLNSGDQHTGYVFTNNGTPLSSVFADTVDAVSYVFMHDAVMNEYTTEKEIAGATEWVITFPTKHFYVYNGDLDSTDVPIAPFTEAWTGEDACEVVRLDTIYDRNEQIPGTPDSPTGEPIPPIVSPAPPPPDNPVLDPIIPFTLCFETNVIEFVGEEDDVSIDAISSILGSSNLHYFNNWNEYFEADHGWARIDMLDYTWDVDANGVLECDDFVGAECFLREPLGDLFGLPVTGFAVNRFANGFLGDGNDVLANYGGIFQHKATVSTASQR